MERVLSDLLERYGPWALVTGASSGIGKALAEKLAEAGFNLGLCALDSEALDVLGERLEAKFGIKTKRIVADISDEAGWQIVQSQSEGLEIGFLVASAGIEVHGDFLNSPLEDELRLIDVNIRAMVVLTQYFAEMMKARGRGAVLLVSSIAGAAPNPYLANYAGSKAYITNFGLSLRYELAQHGVDLSVLAPGPTDTPMLQSLSGGVDMGKAPMPLASPEFVAEYALKKFPKKPLIIPKFLNRVLVFLVERLLPVSWVIRMTGDMMRRIGGR